MVRSFNTRNFSGADIERKISICTFSAAGWVSLRGTGIASLIYQAIHPRASVVRIPLPKNGSSVEERPMPVIPAKAGIHLDPD
jgi:hypothetical protein